MHSKAQSQSQEWVCCLTEQRLQSLGASRPAGSEWMPPAPSLFRDTVPQEGGCSKPEPCTCLTWPTTAQSRSDSFRCSCHQNKRQPRAIRVASPSLKTEGAVLLRHSPNSDWRHTRAAQYWPPLRQHLPAGPSHADRCTFTLQHWTSAASSFPQKLWPVAHSRIRHMPPSAPSPGPGFLHTHTWQAFRGAQPAQGQQLCQHESTELPSQVQLQAWLWLHTRRHFPQSASTL